MNDAKTIGSNALVLDTAEENVTVMNAEESKLGKEVSLIEQRAEAVVVASGADFEDAGLFLKQIKQAQKQVKDYWEPLRVSAKKSYDEVLNQTGYVRVLEEKNDMESRGRIENVQELKSNILGFLEQDPEDATLSGFLNEIALYTDLDSVEADDIGKTKVNEYSAEQEHKRREQEEAMRRLAQAEIDRHLNEAAEAEANGDAVGAEYAMAEAEMMEGVSIAGGVQHQTPKVKGISQSKTWEICESECDWSKVPVSLIGIELRPVDKAAVLRLIKMSKGQVEIPGIKFRETYTTSVSTR